MFLLNSWPDQCCTLNLCEPHFIDSHSVNGMKSLDFKAADLLTSLENILQHAAILIQVLQQSVTRSGHRCFGASCLQLINTLSTLG